MGKQTAAAKVEKAVPAAKVAKAAAVESAKPEIEAIESAIQNLENAFADLEIARVRLIEAGGSVMRIINAKQNVNETLKNIKPYLDA